MSEYKDMLTSVLGGKDAPTDVNSKQPKRKTNKELRPREYLLDSEVKTLIRCAGALGRFQHRDRTLILTAYRHALRVSELVSLQWSQIDFDNAQMHVTRSKNGSPSVHPIADVEIRGLKTLKKGSKSPFVFTSTTGTQLSCRSVHNIIQRAGTAASLGFSVHPHMLRHACGFKLASDGVDTRAIQAYMGHRNIQHTVRYTEVLPDRFKGFWQD